MTHEKHEWLLLALLLLLRLDPKLCKYSACPMQEKAVQGAESGHSTGTRMDG